MFAHPKTWLSRRTARRSCAIGLLLVAAGFALGVARADEHLYEQDAFDQITLDEENAGAVLKVMPIDLPKRIVPAKPNPDDTIRVRLFAKPDKEYEVEWRHIVKVELFESLVLLEAEKRVADEQFDEAYDYYAFLSRKFPNMPQLAPSRHKFLVANARGMAQQQRYAESLALFEELYRQKPDYEVSPGKPVLKFVEAVADRLTGAYVTEADFLSARRLIRRLAEGYGDKLDALTNKWQEKLPAMATEALAAAQKEFAAEHFRAAHDGVKKSLAIWPAVAGGEKLAAEVNAKYPVLIVGVAQTLPDKPLRATEGWAAARRFKLVDATPEAIEGKESSDSTASAAADGYRITSRDKLEVRAVLQSAANPKQVREVDERYFADTSRAIRALRHGEIDVLEQVYPADVAALARDKTLTVTPYSQPTVHLLVPNCRKPLLASRTFRRALEYALDRPAILKRVILGQTTSEGTRTLSAPFAAGLGASDPAATAYDSRIVPRSFDPREAISLIAVAERERSGGESVGGKKAVPIKLVLVHGATEVARFASQAIARQLAVVGIEVTTRELPPGTEPDASGDWDLAYVSLPGGNPLAAVTQLLGEGGLSGNANPVLQATIRRAGLEESSAVMARLKEVHRLAYDDVAVIPLWQLVEHFAVRARVQALEAPRITIYDGLSEVRTSPERGQE